MGFKNLKQRGVMEAARRVMTRQGVENFSMDDVAVEAGVSKGTLYNYFSSKEELVDASIQNAMEPFEKDLNGLFASDLLPLQKIQYMFYRILSYFENRGEFFRVLLFLRESAQFKHREHESEKYQVFVRKVAVVLEEGMDIGQIKRLDPFKTAAVILEISTAIINQRLLLEDPGPVEEDAQFVLEILLRGITEERPVQ